jgi:hypothetical protein
VVCSSVVGTVGLGWFMGDVSYVKVFHMRSDLDHGLYETVCP